MYTSKFQNFQKKFIMHVLDAKSMSKLERISEHHFHPQSDTIFRRKKTVGKETREREIIERALS